MYKFLFLALNVVLILKLQDYTNGDALALVHTLLIEVIIFGATLNGPAPRTMLSWQARGTVPIQMVTLSVMRAHVKTVRGKDPQPKICLLYRQIDKRSYKQSHDLLITNPNTRRTYKNINSFRN